MNKSEVTLMKVSKKNIAALDKFKFSDHESFDTALGRVLALNIDRKALVSLVADQMEERLEKKGITLE